MKIEQPHIDLIRKQFTLLQDKQDLILLLNEANRILYGKKCKTIHLKSLNYYANPEFSKNRYETFTVKKKSGGKRIIHAPVEGLKAILRPLNFVLQCLYTPSKVATEIDRVIRTREKLEWRLPYQITQWIEEDWYINASSKDNNKDMYARYVEKAEEILYKDEPEEVIVVEFVNRNKSMLSFVKNKDKFGFFNYSRHIESPKIGDLFIVRFNGEGDNGYHEILTAKKAGSEVESDAIKKIRGTLKLISPQNFGFVDNTFVDSKLIKNNNLTDGQSVTGKAMLSFNKVKDEWGWKVIEVNL